MQGMGWPCAREQGVMVMVTGHNMHAVGGVVKNGTELGSVLCRAELGFQVASKLQVRQVHEKKGVAACSGVM